MDYRLRRQPDGTVNAQPGDAVEVLVNGKWINCGTVIQIQSKYIDLLEPGTYESFSYFFDSEPMRHARGGAGWHRLREARLREAAERVIDDVEGWQEAQYIDWLVEALADLDNAEPEA